MNGGSTKKLALLPIPGKQSTIITRALWTVLNGFPLLAINDYQTGLWISFYQALGNR